MEMKSKLKKYKLKQKLINIVYNHYRYLRVHSMSITDIKYTYYKNRNILMQTIYYQTVEGIQHSYEIQISLNGSNEFKIYDAIKLYIEDIKELLISDIIYEH